MYYVMPDSVYCVERLFRLIFGGMRNMHGTGKAELGYNSARQE